MLRDYRSHRAALTDDWEGSGAALAARVNVRCWISHAGAGVNDSECWNELARLRLPASSPRGNVAQAGDVRSRSAG
jgi:hypothetical protein